MFGFWGSSSNDESKTPRVRTGFVGTLTSEEEKVLQEFKELCKNEEVDLSVYPIREYETIDHILLRFLRARNFNLQQALKMINDNVKWRKENNIMTITEESPSNIYKCDSQKIAAILPALHPGFDKQGRPVLFKKMGANCVIDTLLEETTVENLIRYHWWSQEKLSYLCFTSSTEKQKHVEAFVTVVDAAGWHVGLGSRKAYSYLKAMADTDSLNYPERMGATIVVNAPKALAIGWNIIKSWLNPVTQQKVNILRGPEEYLPVLKEIMDESVIPEEYGGKFPGTQEAWALWSK
eukprot:c21458_g3_i1.p1 GENE.c21458_g3_i1~~c21458_g3_i1.p1  ORF type:complete len:293 (-),score=101.58 c21458_g3_i1:59-937(-)